MVSFIAEAWGMCPPVMPVAVPRLKYTTSPLEVMSNATINPVGPKSMHPLIKLQQYNGTGSFDTFLTKFQCIASYLRWDDDMLHHLCTSLKGAAGQVLWDILGCSEALVTFINCGFWSILIAVCTVVYCSV